MYKKSVIIKLHCPKFSFRKAINFLTGKETIGRMLLDEHLTEILPRFHGTVLEIGSTPNRSYYKNLTVNAGHYIFSNLHPGGNNILFRIIGSFFYFIASTKKQPDNYALIYTLFAIK